MGRAQSSIKGTSAVRSVINCGTNKDSLFQLGYRRNGRRDFLRYRRSLLLSDRWAGKRKHGRPRFRSLRGGFDPCFGTEPLREQAEFREVVVHETLAFKGKHRFNPGIDTWVGPRYV